ncbi:MAG: hypothetical protein J2P57_02070 [Acidimicrobiaceae bacterium]|nr:hypothetical protein [Acidimicrobiaceae bacterium]
MNQAELGPWEPLSISRIVEVFVAAPFRWWVGGGKALELHLGRSWRGHEDSDIGVVRYELDAVYALLSSWDLHVAVAGELSVWKGERLEAGEHQNNVWCRLAENRPWVLDVTIGDGTDDEWIYRRDPTVRRRWDTAVLRTAEGVPYLAPDLQMLFKSKDVRPKDDIDAAEVIPALDHQQREFLRRLLEPGHPWRQRLL